MSEEKTWRNEKRHRDGSIKIINGKIYARIQYQDEVTGKRKEKLRLAPNRTKAKEFIKDMRKELQEGGQKALESDKVSFRQVAEKYQKNNLVKPVFRNGIKVSGLRSYDRQISLLKPLIAYFDKKPIKSIKPSDLKAYKNHRLQTKVLIEKKIKKENPKKERKKFIWEKVTIERERSVASVNRELSLLRQIFVFAESEDFITRNPFQRAKKLISTAAEIERDRVISFEEELLLLGACEVESRKHLKPLIITALDTAMRKGELLKLLWRDIDLQQGIITVRATNTKTEKMRLIGMTSRVKDELTKLRELSPKKQNSSVFGIKSNFKRSWHSALKKAEINDLHFHDLRHSAITRMIRAGVPISEAMKVSGHTEMKTFQRYVNLTHESVTVSANLLETFNLNQQIQRQSETVSEMEN